MVKGLVQNCVVAFRILYITPLSVFATTKSSLKKHDFGKKHRINLEPKYWGRRQKMVPKLSYCFVVIICLSIGYVHSAQKCMANADCNDGDCCIEYLPFFKRCKDKGDDVGDRCGGQFYCDCKPGLHCVNDPTSLWNYFKLGTGYCSAEKGSSRYYEAEAVLIHRNH